MEASAQDRTWLDSHSKLIDASKPQAAHVRHYPSGKFSHQTDDKDYRLPFFCRNGPEAKEDKKMRSQLDVVT